MSHVKCSLDTELILGFEISSMPNEEFRLVKPRYHASGTTKTESAFQFLSLMDRVLVEAENFTASNSAYSSMPNLELWILEYRSQALAYLMVGSDRESAFGMVIVSLDDCIMIQQGQPRSPRRALGHKFVELDAERLRHVAQSVASVQVGVPVTPVLLLCPNIDDFHPWLIAHGHTDLASDFAIEGYQYHPDLKPPVVTEFGVVYH